MKINENIRYNSSYYNIYSDINYIYGVVVNGVNGAMDIINKDFIEALKENKTDYFEQNKEIETYLTKRGYLTSLTIVEEKEKLLNTGKKLYDIQTGKSVIVIPITYDCNFNCPYCFFWGNKASKETKKQFINNKEKVITKDNISKIINYINNTDYISYSIRFFGGEPLLTQNKHIIAFLTDELIKINKKININITTNGYTINKYLPILKKISDNGIELSIQITIDGPSEIHNKTRRLIGNKKNKGTFSAIIKNIDKILESKIILKIFLRTNVGKLNYKYIEELYNFYKQKDWTDNDKILIYFSLIYSIDFDGLSCVGKDVYDLNPNKIMDILKNIKDTKLKLLIIKMMLSPHRGLYY